LARFSDPFEREQIPDPAAAKTFEASRINWNELKEARHQDWLRFYRNLLKLRCQYIVPRLSDGCAVKGDYEIHGERGLTARWKFPDKSKLILMANLGTDSLPGLAAPDSQIIYASEGVTDSAIKAGALPPWSVVWFLRS
jgi:1,4-alpha-glucan branching enzyme